MPVFTTFACNGGRGKGGEGGGPGAIHRTKDIVTDILRWQVDYRIRMLRTECCQPNLRTCPAPRQARLKSATEEAGDPSEPRLTGRAEVASIDYSGWRLLIAQLPSRARRY